MDFVLRCYVYGNRTGEMSCNSCSHTEGIFLSGFFNVVKICEAKEVILCRDGEEVGTREDIKPETCRKEVFFIGKFFGAFLY